MRQYLEYFFENFNYDKSDAEELLSVYDSIMSNQETATMWQSAIDLYLKDINCDYKKISQISYAIAERLYIQEFTLEYLVYVCLTKRTCEIYKELGIDMKIFYDSMLDMRYKLEECKLVRGIVGSFVSSWFAGFLKLSRFGLGRLQFEIVEFPEHYEKDGKTLNPGDKVINIHIPRSLVPLDKKLCDESFNMAKNFFADQIGDTCAFVCDSWMLYPENADILPKNTNTYHFFSRFDIISSAIDKARVNLWRLFDTDEKDINKLPYDTSLRRAYIDHMKKGGKVGTGFGVFFA